jgi:putative flippase GtrA
MRKEFLRYFFASGGALGVDYLVLFLTVSVIGIHYILGAAAGFIVGSVFVYFLSTYWVFESRRLNDRRQEFFMFIGIGLAALVTGLIVIWFFTEIIGFYYLFSKLISTGVVFLFNFFLRRFFLFRVTNA